MSETIKEFIVSLGWANDEASEKRFREALENGTKKAFEFAAGLEGVVLAAATALNTTAETFQKLGVQAEVLRTSANEVQALQYAFKQLGGTAEQATATLSILQAKMTENPGYSKVWEQLGFKIDETTGKILSFSAAQERAGPLGQFDRRTELGKAQQTQWFKTHGIDDPTTQEFIAGHPEELEKGLTEGLKRQSTFGVDLDDLAKKSAEFAKNYGSISNSIQQSTNSWAGSIEDALNGPLKKLDDKMKEHPEWTNAAVATGAVAGAGGVGLFVKAMAGGFGLGGAATELTGAATALDEAAGALSRSALTKGPGGTAPSGVVPDGSPKTPGGGGWLSGLAATFAKWTGIYTAAFPALQGPTAFPWDAPVDQQMDAEKKSDDEERKKIQGFWSWLTGKIGSGAAPIAPVAAPSSADRHAAYRSLQNAGYNTSFLGIGGTSYIDEEVGNEEGREARRGRALGGLTEAPGQRKAADPPKTQEQPHRVATATPKQPEDDLRDQRFEALRAMLDIGTSDSARAVTVNGAPVSEGNPLPVTFGQKINCRPKAPMHSAVAEAPEVGLAGGLRPAVVRFPTRATFGSVTLRHFSAASLTRMPRRQYPSALADGPEAFLARGED